MQSRFICISYALDDAPEASKIASIVREIGWDVRFTHAVEPALDVHDRRAGQFDRAACVIVVWSSNASNTTVLRQDAEAAARIAKLVLIVLDDAALPVQKANVITVVDWRSGRDHASRQFLIDGVTRYAGTRRKRTGRIVSDARPNSRTILAVSGGALLTSCAILATSFFLGQGQIEDWRRSDAQSLAGEEGGRTVPTLKLRSSREDTRPEADLRNSDSVDPIVGPSLGAASSERQLGWEEAAWQGIIARDDLLLQLEDLTNFRIDFPRGRYASLARQLELEQQDELLRVRAHLTHLGYLPSTSAANDETLRRAIGSFEQSLGLTPSGKLTRTSISALNVAFELSTSGAVSTPAPPNASQLRP